jgi:HK97 family phage major capsid protein
MSTMTTTMTRESEGRLRTLQAEIANLEREAAGKQEAANELTRELVAEGKDPTRDKAAAKKVDAAYREADVLLDKVKTLRAEADTIIEKAIGGRIHGASEGRAPWTLTPEGVEELRLAGEAGIFGRVGQEGWSPAFRSEVGYWDPIAIDQMRSIELLPVELVRIADHIPGVPTDSPRVHYQVMVTDATAAAAVAPGADKPESSPDFDQAFADVVKVAHYAQVKDEFLKDYVAWQTVIRDVMIRGLIQAENDQLLNGAGAGEDMVGLLQTPNIIEITRDTTNESRLDCLLRAITVLRTTSFMDPNLIVLHPTDFYETRIEKDQQDQYLAGNPLTAAPAELWGVKVLVTTSAPEGTGLVGNLPNAARVYWREAPIFEVHPGGGGKAEWIANKTLVRAEERMVLAVHRPEALVAVHAL